MRMLAGAPAAALVLGCAPPAQPGPDGRAPLEGGAPSDGGNEVDTRALPPFFRLQATAEHTSDDGRTASCLLDLHFELQEETKRTPDVLEMTGVHGGEASRQILTSDGAGTAFRADVFAEVTVRWTLPGVLEIEIPINATGEGRFWQNLARFDGTYDGTGQGAGTWLCGPFDIEQGGYVDTDLPADGTWTIAPEQVEPEP